MSFISVENVSFHYDNNDPERLITENVIENLNMKVEKGEFLCVLGHNGSSMQSKTDLQCFIHLMHGRAVE